MITPYICSALLLGALLSAGSGCSRPMTAFSPDDAAVPGTGSWTSAGGATAGSSGASNSGGTTGLCSGCQSIEECWNGQFCVAKTMSLPAGFAIDATEVTRGQYAAWLATNPPTDRQVTGCSWNASFAPESTCMNTLSVCSAGVCDNHPQPCVDYCDATRYCKAVGKHLCTDAEWSTACTSNGVNLRPYGNTLVDGACNDYTMDNSTTVPVGSNPGCQSPVSGYGGVYDLMGNVAELTDPCSGGCKPKGQSFGTGAASPRCSNYTYTELDKAYTHVGFRCCSQ